MLSVVQIVNDSQVMLSFTPDEKDDRVTLVSIPMLAQYCYDGGHVQGVWRTERGIYISRNYIVNLGWVLDTDATSECFYEPCMYWSMLVVDVTMDFMRGWDVGKYSPLVISNNKLVRLGVAEDCFGGNEVLAVLRVSSVIYGDCNSGMKYLVITKRVSKYTIYGIFIDSSFISIRVQKLLASTEDPTYFSSMKKLFVEIRKRTM